MMSGPTPAEATALNIIRECRDERQIRNFLENARKRGSSVVEEAALRRLATILAKQDGGPVALDFWRSIHALEETLSHESGVTKRLSRTRQKVGRVGATITVRDLVAAAAPSSGFTMLLDRKMADMTAEAIVLRHQHDFEAAVVSLARGRLAKVGINEAELER